MKKFLSLILVTGSLFVLGCGKTPATGIDSNSSVSELTGQAVVERKSYANTTDAFTLQYPTTRVFKENVFGSSVVFFTPMNTGDTVSENIGIMKKSLDKEYTLDEYYAIMKPELTKLVPEFTEVSNESIKINDVNAQKLIYKGTEGSKKLQWEQVYLIKNKAVYIITYTALEDTFNQFNQTLDEMIATLEIK
ncbi:MAG: PsbP-related protein [candidate division SR1 bacterium]|nr:PsbP-related protein [candidate division SR1 bacterium]